MSHIFMKGQDEPVSVGKIVCVGANYDDHNKEMGRTKRVEAVLFLKPPTALLHHGGTVLIPPFSTEVQHELEMVLLIGKAGKRIKAEDAPDHIAAVAVGLDMTARDLQRTAKEHGLPWAMAKGFDTSAPVSEFVPVSEVDPDNAELFLAVNGAVRQQCNTADMILSSSAIVSYVSRFFCLEPGDLIYTGTPAGVQPVKEGERLEITLSEIVTASFSVSEELDVEKC